MALLFPVREVAMMRFHPIAEDLLTEVIGKAVTAVNRGTDDRYQAAIYELSEQLTTERLRLAAADSRLRNQQELIDYLRTNLREQEK